MSSPKNMNARERARLAAEQAAARKRYQRILIAVIAGFVVVVVAAGIGFQAWRTTRSPSAAPSSSVSATPVTISDGRPIVLGSPQAPATISLYEDFHCPHCAEFEEQFGPVIREAQESGAARVELYPLSFIDEGSAAAANAMASAANTPASISRNTTKAPTPIAALIRKNCRFDQVSQACCILTCRGTDFCLACSASSSLSVPSTCSRRVFVGLRVERAGATDPVRATVSMRFSAFRSPDRRG